MLMWAERAEDWAAALTDCHPEQGEGSRPRWPELSTVEILVAPLLGMTRHNWLFARRSRILAHAPPNPAAAAGIARAGRRASQVGRLARLRRQARPHALLDDRPDHAGERRASCRSRGRTRRTTSSRARRCRRIRSSSTACCTRRRPSSASSRSTPRPAASSGRFDANGGNPPASRFRHRGVVVTGDRVLFTYRNKLWALDKKTGKPIPSFGVDGAVDLREGLGRPADGAVGEREHAGRRV